MVVEKESLCLYGYPDGSWEVKLPVVDVPSDLPEPFWDINHPREWMQKKDWRSFVAAHSDAWLLSLALFFGAWLGFGKSERYRSSPLFLLIFTSLNSSTMIVHKFCPFFDQCRCIFSSLLLLVIKGALRPLLQFSNSMPLAVLDLLSHAAPILWPISSKTAFEEKLLLCNNKIK